METAEKSSFLIIEKPEVYSFDEIQFLLTIDENNRKLCALKNALSERMKDSAVFFMPEQSFAVFSVFQGDNSICEILMEDFEKIAEKLEKDGAEESGKMALHMREKLRVLTDFLKNGGKVHPVLVSQDKFEKI